MRKICTIECGKVPTLRSLQLELLQRESILYLALLLGEKEARRENKEEGIVASGNRAPSEPLLTRFQAA